MSETEKPMNVLTKPHVQEMLKYRSKQLGIKMGEQIGNLVSSLENRLIAAYRIGALDQRDDETDVRLMAVIFHYDENKGVESEKTLHDKFRQICLEARERKLPARRWRPAFTYPDLSDPLLKKKT